MIPGAVFDAAMDRGWAMRTRGRFRFTLERGPIVIEGSRNLYRHTQARAYRGNALTDIFRSQREIVAYLAAN